MPVLATKPRPAFFGGVHQELIGAIQQDDDAGPGTTKAPAQSTRETGDTLSAVPRCAAVEAPYLTGGGPATHSRLPGQQLAGEPCLPGLGIHERA